MGEMAALSHRAAQGFACSCREAGWTQAKTEGYRALEHPLTSSCQLWGCAVPPVWAARHRKKCIDPERRALDHPCGLWFWEGARRVSPWPQSALRTAYVWDFCTESLLDDTYAWLFLSLARGVREVSKRVNKQMQHMNAKVNCDVLAKYCSPRSMDMFNF